MKKYNANKSASFVFHVFGCIALLCAGLIAQETTVTNTNGQNGSSDTTSSQPQDNDDGYDIRSSIELGIRADSVDGNENKYKSDLNYRGGFRIFDSTFLATTDDSSGKPFDTLLITGSGWSADRNGFARVNMEKMGAYKFTSTVRRFEYFNNLLNFAKNQHTRNTKHMLGDFDVTLLPQNETVNLRFGYSFDTNSGPQMVTYDFSRDEFPVDSNYDTNANDLRGGVDLNVLGFNLSFTQGYRRFRENTDFSITSLALGNNPNPNASINTLSRELPTRGTTNYSRFSIHRNFNKRVDFSGRLIYSDTKTDFDLIQRLTGTNRFGNTVVLDEINSSGDARRPNTFGDFGVTFFITDDFSISNTFGFNSYRITGGQLLRESVLINPPGMPAVVDTELVHRLTNYRRYINTLQGDWDVNRFLSFYLGYRYTDRHIELTGLNLNVDTQSSSTFIEEADNTTNSFLGGFKLKPIPRKLRIYFNIEHGETDNVFTRTANYDFTNIKVRTQIDPVDDLSLSFLFETKDNDNPSRPNALIPQQLASNLKARIFSSTLTYAPNSDLTLNGGFTHNRLTTEADIVFPRFGPLDLGTSIYELRSNFLFFDAWVRPHPRLSIFGAYRITKDTGSGDLFNSSDQIITGNYPLQFQSPEFRVIFKVNDNVDFNAGYQYYDYSEKMLSIQDYQAHLPYISIRFYFGGAKDR